MAIASYLIIHKSSICGADPLLNELNQLAKSEGMEFVIGDRIAVINPYGSYGSTYVLDFIFQPQNNLLEHSVLFLCRKKRADYTKNGEERTLKLVHKYSYHLLFATKMQGDNAYKTQNIIPDVGLKGMALYYGRLNKDLSEFKYITDPNISGPKGVQLNFTNGCIPIIISCESSTQILYYYNNKWLEYVEVDE